MLNWASRFSIFCFLDNNGYSFDTPSFECILAAGAKRSVQLTPGNAFHTLRDFYDEVPGWLFGHLGYDLKNETEQLLSSHPDRTGFGAGFFFEPEVIVRISAQQVEVLCEQDGAGILKMIEDEPAEIMCRAHDIGIIQQTTEKSAYLDIIGKLKQHILRGDCYEINFCQHFFAEETIADPLYLFDKLLVESPSPFAALYRVNDKYCICASPERYLKKNGNTLISQPMKGTSGRDIKNEANDRASKEYLRNSAKDKSENVMVVDLVRNDLSRICEEGSVFVEELFGIYSFPQVHQMISTVKGTARSGMHWTEIIKATFPMGSMTGAPKKKVMELIETYESVNRGLFSGAIGYITPLGNFDFNVVIRSIFYNETNKYLSFFAGGGITFYSKAEEEYEESILKTKAIKSVLTK